MSGDLSITSGASPEVKRQARTRRIVVYRHPVLLRLTHWINALAIVVLIGSGLNIFSAHPNLYWGQKGDEYDRPILSIHSAPGAGDALRGVTQIGPLQLHTTGVLGASRAGGQWMDRAWPAWLTIPGGQDLADARRWHFFFAWVLALNGLVYLVWAFTSRHVQRDLWPTLGDLKAIPRSAWDHLRNKHPHGEAALRYNVLQRLAYLGLVALVAGMVLTGLTMSPGIDAVAPWLLDLFGGRQSARSLHFVFASLIFMFILVHLSQVVLAGPINEMRSITTGRYAVTPEHD